MNHFYTTRMLRKGRCAVKEERRDDCRFTLAKAMTLASIGLKQRSCINSAASFLMDGHCVNLSEELVEMKPSILRSEKWETGQAYSPQTQATPGTIRVCWQCPQASPARKSLSERRD